MSLVTGTPVGILQSTEDVYFEGAPNLYIQRYEANPLYNPDAQGFYWGMTGTSTYNVYEIGCISDFNVTENLTVNDVLCDNIGVKGTVQQRNFIEMNFSIKSFFPFQTLTHLLGGGTVTAANHMEKFGFGKINNNVFWHVYAPKVYDESVGAYIWIWLHKAKFVDAWTINMPFGNSANITGLKLRAFADTTKPAAQLFGMFGRFDPSLT